MSSAVVCPNIASPRHEGCSTLGVTLQLCWPDLLQQEEEEEEEEEEEGS